MKPLGRILILVIALLAIIALNIQEKLIFFPDTLTDEYSFSFNESFQELFFKVDKKTTLNGLLFKTDTSKGVIFYLHGNAGSIASWGNNAGLYIDNGYDFFVLDYRGFGKSQGRISSEKQIHRDMQIVYDSLKTMYPENRIIIIGYSIGTGFAAKLAANNHPNSLILKAPYHSLIDLANQHYRLVPSFLIKYKVETHRFISKVRCPIIIFHGDKDEVIDYASSEKLQALFKPKDRLIPLKGQTHNGINSNRAYIGEMKSILMNGANTTD